MYIWHKSSVAIPELPYKVLEQYRNWRDCNCARGMMTLGGAGELHLGSGVANQNQCKHITVCIYPYKYEYIHICTVYVYIYIYTYTYTCIHMWTYM